MEGRGNWLNLKFEKYIGFFFFVVVLCFFFFFFLLSCHFFSIV